MPSGSSKGPFRNLRLPDSLRASLASPMGPIFPGEDAREALSRVGEFAACGDVVTKNALEWGLHPFLAIVDGKTERKEEIPSSSFQTLFHGRTERVRNPAATISAELQEAIHRLVSGGGGLLWVDGEEDLAVLPLLLEMREGTTVIYGQPRRGLCMVTVNDEHRRSAKSIMEQMEVD